MFITEFIIFLVLVYILVIFVHFYLFFNRVDKRNEKESEIFFSYIVELIGISLFFLLPYFICQFIDYMFVPNLKVNWTDAMTAFTTYMSSVVLYVLSLITIKIQKDTKEEQNRHNKYAELIKEIRKEGADVLQKIQDYIRNRNDDTFETLKRSIDHYSNLITMTNEMQYFKNEDNLKFYKNIIGTNDTNGMSMVTKEERKKLEEEFRKGNLNYLQTIHTYIKEGNIG